MRTPWSESRKQLERRPAVVRQRIGWEERGFPHMVLALSSEVQTLMCWANFAIKSLIISLCVSAINGYIYHLSLYLSAAAAAVWGPPNFWGLGSPFLLPPITATLQRLPFQMCRRAFHQQLLGQSQQSVCVCVCAWLVFLHMQGCRLTLCGLPAIIPEGQMLGNFPSNVKVKPWVQV